ncbi:hypothetical protein U9M48_033885, partial [Paspalum notatum var. saurae]
LSVARRRTIHDEEDPWTERRCGGGGYNRVRRRHENGCAGCGRAKREGWRRRFGVGSHVGGDRGPWRSEVHWSRSAAVAGIAGRDGSGGSVGWGSWESSTGSPFISAIAFSDFGQRMLSRARVLQKKGIAAEAWITATDTPIYCWDHKSSNSPELRKGLIKHAIYRTLERHGQGVTFLQQVVLLGSAPDHCIQGEFTNLASQLHGEYHGPIPCQYALVYYNWKIDGYTLARTSFLLLPSLNLVNTAYCYAVWIHPHCSENWRYVHIKNRSVHLSLHFKLALIKGRATMDAAEASMTRYLTSTMIRVGLKHKPKPSNQMVSVSKELTAVVRIMHSTGKVMEQDWSWNRPASDYMELYHSARKN